MDILRYRLRDIVAAIFGIVAGGAASSLGVMPGASGLIGWDVAAIAFLMPTIWAFLVNDEAKVRARAKQEDENRAVLMSLILACVVASLGAIIMALREAKGGHHHTAPLWLAALSASTLVLSWLVVQALFTLHYTHRYFGDRDEDGEEDGGIKFPGERPTTYRDFIYVAVCVGATCQVSDFNIMSSRFRNLITVHAAIAFFFNTMIISLGINIIGNVMGQ